MKTIKLLALVLSAALIAGCEGKGGGSGGNGHSGVILPPDPGSEGRKTLEGIDSNNNGIRDDVEIAIYSYAPKPDEERLRQAMIQEAKVMQMAIAAGHTKDPQAINEAREAISAAVACIVFNTKEEYAKGDFLKFMERKAVNTPARLEAYMRYNEALSGRVFSSAREPIPCDYDREREAKAQAAFNAQAFNIQSAYNLPPDPGSAGKAALEGIDSNNNGIRDDVEIAIYSYAPRPDQEKLRQAMIQRAKAFQAALTVDTSDPDALKEAFRNGARANECLRLKSVRKDNQEQTVVLDAIRNTRERSKALKAYSKALEANGVYVFKPSGDPNPCDFDRSARMFAF